MLRDPGVLRAGVGCQRQHQRPQAQEGDARHEFGRSLYGLVLMSQDEAAGKLQAGQDLRGFGFAALAPFLWASAMRFRLGATRWRGQEAELAHGAAMV